MRCAFSFIISKAHLAIDMAVQGFFARRVAELVHADERLVAIAVEDTLAAEGSPAAGSAINDEEPDQQAERGD
jgi:hypothetical protein